MPTLHRKVTIWGGQLGALPTDHLEITDVVVTRENILHLSLWSFTNETKLGQFWLVEFLGVQTLSISFQARPYPPKIVQRHSDVREGLEQIVFELADGGTISVAAEKVIIIELGHSLHGI